MSNNGFSVERDPLFNENNLIWMDLEMTGLEPQINRILEMAAVVTDPQLNVIAEGQLILGAASLLAVWKVKLPKTMLQRFLLISSLNMSLPAKARCAETQSDRTADSWRAGHLGWSSFSITGIWMFPPLRNASNVGHPRS